MTAGKCIKRFAEERNMTLKELANKSGVSYNTLYAIIKRDNETVKPEIAQKIANAFGVSVNILLYDEEIDNQQRTQEYVKKLFQTISELAPDLQISLLSNFYYSIEYITRIPSSNGQRDEISSNLCNLLNHYSKMIMNGIELSMGTSFRSGDFLLLLRNYDNSIRLIGEHKETMIKLAISLSKNDEKLLEFLDKNR